MPPHHWCRFGMRPDHARMKLAMVMAGRLKSAAVRPPTHEPDEATRRQIAAALKKVGMLQKEAA
jgi:4-hydroxy-tetrahydrodipicolinate synthase